MGPANSARVVARYNDGRIIKGYTQNFDPTKDMFPVVLRDAQSGDEPVWVRLTELKALFFVEDFDGESEYTERKEFQKPNAGRRLTVRFTDGEVLLGTSLTYHPTRSGFFLFPGDPFSNNRKVYVIGAAVVEVADAA